MLSVAAVVSKTIPKEAFDYLKWTSYEAYAFFTTLFTIGTAAYVLLLVALMALTTRNSAPRRGVELVLVFIEAVLARRHDFERPLTVRNGKATVEPGNEAL